MWVLGTLQPGHNSHQYWDPFVLELPQNLEREGPRGVYNGTRWYGTLSFAVLNMYTLYCSRHTAAMRPNRYARNIIDSESEVSHAADRLCLVVERGRKLSWSSDKCPACC